MEQITRQEFDSLIADLQETWGKPYSERELIVLWKRIQKLPQRRLSKAIETLIEQCKFRPSVAEILSVVSPYLGDNYKPPQGDRMTKEEGREFMRRMREAAGLRPKKAPVNP